MGSILPGVSGSMIAAVLKIYQELIEALNQFTKEPFNAVKAVWQYILGVFIGFGMGFVLIKVFYEHAPVPITLLFIGFIIGAIPSLISEIKEVKIKWHHVLTFFIAIGIMLALLFVKEQSSTMDSWTQYLIVFTIGVITAMALITPGLSGATILIAIGYFHILVNLGDEIIRAFVTFDFSKIVNILPMMFSLVLGVLVGLILIGKIMYKVLKNYSAHFYIAVLGIVFISPFNILFTLQHSTNQNVFTIKWYIYFIGVILLLLGIFATYKLSKPETNLEDLK